ncbi:MAG TPA: 30S ribosomal protein S7 [Planctomycetota bacterium]|jgi:small subunit ribosomal protein S7|nr:30S ribosomal protein S7 [Planctomycetota bacterium]
MPAKFKSFEHLLRPDPRFKNKMVGKFINCLMRGGKKSLAQQIFYDALGEVKKKVPDKEPVDIFLTAINNVKPVIEVRSRRVGGATYQVPVPVPAKRQISLAYRWIIGAARGKKGRPMHLKLADELHAAYRGEGEAMKKREDVHKMAEANKAFAHLAY